MFEIKHLRSLLALRETDSLALASSILHMSQSALSHQFSELEQRLGKGLFIRKTNPIQFTAEGLLLLSLAEQILPMIEQTECLMKGEQPVSHLRVAMECHSCIRWLTPVFTRLKQEYPQIEFDFSGQQLFTPQQALIEGSLDIVLTSDPLPSGNIHYASLFDFEMRALMSQDHPLSHHQRLTPDVFASEVLLTYPVEHSRLDVLRFFLEPAHVHPAKIKNVDNTHMLIQMVAAGWGITVMPDWVCREFESTTMLKSAALGEGLWRKLYAAVRIEGKDKPEYQAVFRAPQQAWLR